MDAPSNAASPTTILAPAAPTGDPLQAFRARAILIAKLVVSIVVVMYVLWTAASVFLLLFAGVLIAILLQSVAMWISHLTHLHYGWALLTVVLALVSLLAVAGVQFSTKFTQQANQLASSVQRSIGQIEQQLNEYQWFKDHIDLESASKTLGSERGWLSRMTNAATTLLGAISSVAIVFFVGVYGAVDPGLYRRGLLRLIPRSSRARANSVIDRAWNTLRWWLAGRFANMAIVGVVTAIGLWLLGIPMAMLLGLIAFALDFIPYVGPIVSAVPALTVASALGMNDVLWVLLLYLGVQTAESYFLQPMIQKRSVELPPVLAISGQLVLGTLFGTMGLVVATPFLVLTIVLVQSLYVEATLGDRMADEQSTMGSSK